MRFLFNCPIFIHNFHRPGDFGDTEHLGRAARAQAGCSRDHRYGVFDIDAEQDHVLGVSVESGSVEWLGCMIDDQIRVLDCGAYGCLHKVLTQMIFGEGAEGTHAHTHGRDSPTVRGMFTVAPCYLFSFAESMTWRFQSRALDCLLKVSC